MAVCATIPTALCLGAAGAQGAPAADDGPPRGIVTIRMVGVGAPGNAPVGVVPFQGPPDQGIYQSCAGAPAGCQLVGGVGYRYRIGELEITVGQYVTFLNTADPEGTNRHDLYLADMSPSAWPKYGSIRRSSGPRVALGRHYSAAYPQWEDKPLGFANFLRSARFANSLSNGDILSRRTSRTAAKTVYTYRVRLSRRTERGMYDLRSGRRTGPTRARTHGFVIPSQDEWIKAAYHDPAGGGTFSYWQYPTGPFDPPGPSSLNLRTGDVVNAAGQPLSTYSPQGPKAPAGTFPTWCPPQAGPARCDTVNPLGLPAAQYQLLFQGNLSTVGQTRTTSPWGTLDQGGNAVEWTDTITPAPAGPGDARVWRRLHGGVPNAPAVQLWISALGLQPQAKTRVDDDYPWLGFRVGLIGDPGRAGR